MDSRNTLSTNKTETRNMEVIPIINAQLQGQLSRCQEENLELKKIVSKLVTGRSQSKSEEYLETIRVKGQELLNSR